MIRAEEFPSSDNCGSTSPLPALRQTRPAGHPDNDRLDWIYPAIRDQSAPMLIETPADMPGDPKHELPVHERYAVLSPEDRFVYHAVLAKIADVRKRSGLPNTTVEWDIDGTLKGLTANFIGEIIKLSDEDGVTELTDLSIITGPGLLLAETSDGISDVEAEPSIAVCSVREFVPVLLDRQKQLYPDGSVDNGLLTSHGLDYLQDEAPQLFASHPDMLNRSLVLSSRRGQFPGFEEIERRHRPEEIIAATRDFVKPEITQRAAENPHAPGALDFFDTKLLIARWLVSEGDDMQVSAEDAAELGIGPEQLIELNGLLEGPDPECGLERDPSRSYVLVDDFPDWVEAIDHPRIAGVPLRQNRGRLYSIEPDL